MWHTCEFLPTGHTLISNWSAKHVSVRCGQHFVQKKSVKAAQTQRGPLFWAGPPQTVWQISGKNWDIFYLASYLNIFSLTGNKTFTDSFQHQWMWEAGTYWFLNQVLLLLWASHPPCLIFYLSANMAVILTYHLKICKNIWFGKALCVLQTCLVEILSVFLGGITWQTPWLINKMNYK